MAIKRKPRAPEVGYEKISATIEKPVLRRIRERSSNVSEFLNDAAKRKLYFDHLEEGVRELERQGFHGDPKRVERIRGFLRGEWSPPRRK
jgi:hypothetical protein